MWESPEIIVSSKVTCKDCKCMQCKHLNSNMCYTICTACEEDKKGVTDCKGFSKTTSIKTVDNSI